MEVRELECPRDLGRLEDVRLEEGACFGVTIKRADGKGVEQYDGGFGSDVEDKKVRVARENRSADLEGGESAVEVGFSRDNVNDGSILTFGKSVKHGGDKEGRGGKMPVGRREGKW